VRELDLTLKSLGQLTGHVDDILDVARIFKEGLGLGLYLAKSIAVVRAHRNRQNIGR
jgi:hypothetical protein